MNQEEGIELYLRRIAAGEDDQLPLLMRCLSEHMLYTPVTQVAADADGKGTKKVKVASFSSGGKNIVPSFTTEEYFLEWSDGKHQCFSVAGGDLALTLPKGTWLVINPGTSSTVELSPEQLAVVALGEIPPPEEPAAREEEDAEAELNLEPPIEEVRANLSAVLRANARIEEAYFQYYSQGATRAVLGLLTPSLSPEERFVLIDQIAEVSRRYFGTAGAIEVFDDLGLKRSSSWQLFNALTPFYEREDRREEPRQEASAKEGNLIGKQMGRIAGFLRPGK